MAAARHGVATPAEVPSILGLYVAFAVGGGGVKWQSAHRRDRTFTPRI
jgi:hypothetical protein